MPDSTAVTHRHERFLMIIRNSLPETELKTSDFYYDLPESQIAQTPIYPRDASRLLRLGKETGEISHHIFRDIEDMLEPGDTLVINDSKVIPARLYGNKLGDADELGGDVELLLLRRRAEAEWECLVKPGKRARPGHRLSFGGGILTAEVGEIVDDGCRVVNFSFDSEKYTDVLSVLDEIGIMPLPPYITAKLEDKSRYQTVYAKDAGSAAAPTAGLHFTPELMARLEAKGVKFARVQLHVGLGTFRPVKEENIADHVMHTEYITVTPETAELINSRRRAGGRTIAVGTTSCRTLESVADENGNIVPMSGDTGIFIYPGYKFRAIDGLITNFHLPESTLIMLVSALAGKENVMSAYETAVKEGYRFFSFGDAMVII